MISDLLMTPDNLAAGCKRYSADGIVSEAVAHIEQTLVLVEVNDRLCHDVIHCILCPVCCVLNNLFEKSWK